MTLAEETCNLETALQLPAECSSPEQYLDVPENGCNQLQLPV